MPFLSDGGVPVKIDTTRGIAHNKVMVIDGETVITGSFNFSKAAEEKNAENFLIIHERKLAEKYVKNWQEHYEHSDPYIGNGVTNEHPVPEELVQEKDEVSGSQR